ncbi:MAG: hypothetical protein M0T85_16110 [Dehalococcoidales bacterium]|nr:hypothetical protein [Dehalococcoidales bacterium]
MTKPKLRAPKDDTSTSPEAEARAVPLSPLNVSGVVVKKKDLVEALRIYVPLIADIQAFEDGENFYIILGGQNGNEAAPVSV